MRQRLSYRRVYNVEARKKREKENLRFGSTRVYLGFPPRPFSLRVGLRLSLFT